jgi:ketosteroid isomerase-like protein
MTSTSEEHVAIVKGIYEAAGRGDVDLILDAVHDDVDWAGEADPPVSPWDGQRVGKDEVARFFADLKSVGALEDAELTPLAFGTSETEVFVFLRFRFVATTTGHEAAMNLHHYWRFRDGKVEFFRGSEDTAQLASVWEK